MNLTIREIDDMCERWFEAGMKRGADEEREACARIAETHESPWQQDHPAEHYVRALSNIVSNAILGEWDRGDDNEPETAIAKAIYAFLTTGQTAIDRLFGTTTVSAAIRARSAPRSEGAKP